MPNWWHVLSRWSYLNRLEAHRRDRRRYAYPVSGGHVGRIESLEPRVLLSASLTSTELLSRLDSSSSLVDDGAIKVLAADTTVRETSREKYSEDAFADLTGRMVVDRPGEFTRSATGQTRVDGTAAADFLVSQSDSGLVFGGDGDDTLAVLPEDADPRKTVTVDAGAGDDFIYAMAGNATIDGGAGHDVLFVGDAKARYTGVEEVWVRHAESGTWTAQAPDTGQLDNTQAAVLLREQRDPNRYGTFADPTPSDAARVHALASTATLPGSSAALAASAPSPELARNGRVASAPMQRGAYTAQPRGSTTAQMSAALGGSGQNSYYRQGGDGLLTFEAEHWTRNLAGDVDDWVLEADASASNGEVMVANPDDGNFVGSGSAPAVAPQLSFDVEFLQSGTHFVWIRGLGADSESDSIHVGLDGVLPSTSDDIHSAGTGAYVWSGLGGTATLDVTTPGLHTIDVWMREDGHKVDKVLITTDPAYVPSGEGPAESTLITPPPPPTEFFQQSASGLLAIEAEHWDANSAGAVDVWSNVSDAAASGGEGVYAGPDNSNFIGDANGAYTLAPHLSYDVEFLRSGTHYVWVLGHGADGGGDSIHVGLDGVFGSTADNVWGFASGSYSWSRSTDSGYALLEVAETGLHTIDLWMREDGFTVDKIVVTSDPGYVPSGAGPSESAIALAGTTQAFPAPLQSADLQVDGSLDVSDIDALRARFGPAELYPGSNFFPDDVIDEKDVKFLVHALHVKGLGDANFNGLVEQGDLNLVLNNWGATGGMWSLGDFDGNGLTEQADMNMALNNWGKTPDDPVTTGGTSGDDQLYGLNGDDVLIAGDGNDFLWGGLGADELKGEAGVDSYFDLGARDTVFDVEGIDNDFDGLTNAYEVYSSETDPDSYADTDGDGLSDDWEDYYGFDSLTPTAYSSSPDGDTLDLGAEYSAGTSPLRADTDLDGSNDDVELSAGSSAVDGTELPSDVAGRTEDVRFHVSSINVPLQEGNQRWSMRVGGRQLIMPDLGHALTEYVDLVRGRTYPISIRQIDYDDSYPQLFTWDNSVLAFTEGFILRHGPADVTGNYGSSPVDASLSSHAELVLLDFTAKADAAFTYVPRHNDEFLVPIRLNISKNLNQADIVDLQLRIGQSLKNYYFDAEGTSAVPTGFFDPRDHGFIVGEEFVFYAQAWGEDSSGRINIDLDITGNSWSGGLDRDVYLPSFDGNIVASTPNFSTYSDVDESEESGVPILVNSDDDNENGIRDNAVDESPTQGLRDNDLVKLYLSDLMDNPPANSGTFELVAEGPIELFAGSDGYDAVGPTVTLDPTAFYTFYVGAMDEGDASVKIVHHAPDGYSYDLDVVQFEAVDIDGPILAPVGQEMTFTVNNSPPPGTWKATGSPDASRTVVWTDVIDDARIEYEVDGRTLRHDVTNQKIDILNATLQPVDSLSIANWDHAYDAQGTFLGNTDIVEAEDNRFYVRVEMPNLAGQGEVPITVSVDSPSANFKLGDTDHDDPVSVVVAYEDPMSPGIFYTLSQALVASSYEDEFSNEFLGIDEGLGEVDDRTHLAALGAEVEVAVNVDGQVGELIKEVAEVEVEHVLSNIDIILYRDVPDSEGGNPIVSIPQVKEALTFAGERFAASGIQLNPNIVNRIILKDPFVGVNTNQLSHDPIEFFDDGDVAEVLRRDGTVDNTDITVVYVGSLLIEGVPGAEAQAVRAFTFGEFADIAETHDLDLPAEIENSILMAGHPPNNSSTLAHELMHILMDASHEDFGPTAEQLFFGLSPVQLDFENRWRIPEDQRNSLKAGGFFD